MAKNDRYVVNHPDGWAVRGPGKSRASGVFDTQREAEQRANGDRRQPGRRRGSHSGP